MWPGNVGDVGKKNEEEVGEGVRAEGRRDEGRREVGGRDGI